MRDALTSIGGYAAQILDYGEMHADEDLCGLAQSTERQVEKIRTLIGYRVAWSPGGR